MKKSLAFLTGICLVLSSGLASAVTLNGWDVGNPTAVRASGLVNGSKTFGDVTKTSKALITPNASQVSKILRGGVAGVALTVAVNELLDGVDWVLDPANNSISYYTKQTGACDSNSCSAFPKLYSLYNTDPYDTFSNQNAACQTLRAWIGVSNGSTFTFSRIENNKCVMISDLYPDYRNWDRHYEIYIVQNPAYDPNAKPNEKTLPLDTASQKVISNADAGNTDAQVATVAAAQNILNEAENDAEKAKPIVQQLENNSTDLNPPVLLSKGRKQNIDNEYVRSVQNKENGDEDPCEWLKNLRNSEPDKAIKKKIKTAEKRFNCDGKNRFDKN